MEKKKSKLASFVPYVMLALFAISAVASSSTQKVVNDPDFQEGFREGWRIGSEIGSGVSMTEDELHQLADSVLLDAPSMASIE